MQVCVIAGEAKQSMPNAVITGHSRSKNGVASARLFPVIHVLLSWGAKDVDGRVKPGHDEKKRRDDARLFDIQIWCGSRSDAACERVTPASP